MIQENKEEEKPEPVKVHAKKAPVAEVKNYNSYGKKDPPPTYSREDFLYPTIAQTGMIDGVADFASQFVQLNENEEPKKEAKEEKKAEAKEEKKEAKEEKKEAKEEKKEAKEEKKEEKKKDPEAEGKEEKKQP